MRAKRIILTAAIAGGGLLSPSPAVADSAPSAQSAGHSPSEDVVRDLLAHASAALDQGSFIEASDYYRAALKLKPSRETSCNLGVAARLSGNPIEAAQAFAVCLAEPLPANATPEEKRRRTRLEADREVVRNQVGTIEVKTVQGAKVLLDEIPVDIPALPVEVFVRPGSHRVHVEHKGRTASRSIFVGAGKRVSLELTPEDKPKHEPAANAPTPAKTEVNRPLVLLGQVATGVALGTGAVAYGASRAVRAGIERDQEGARAVHPMGCSVPSPAAVCSDIASKNSTSGTLQTIALAGVIAGAVIGGGTLIYALATKPDSGPAVSASSTGATIGWRGRW